MDENVVDQHFRLLRNTRKDFRVPLKHQPIHRRLLPRNLQNQWIHLISCRIKMYRTILNRIILTTSSKFIGENAEGILGQRDKVKVTDQSEALFKQKRWFKTKTNDRVA